MKLRHIVLFAWSLLAATVAHAEARAPAIPDYPAEQVAAHTWVIHGPTGYPSPENKGFMNNPAFVLTSAGVVVVDPGSSVQTGAMLLRQIAKVTDAPVVAVLNTHVHGDHWLGNHAVREAYPTATIYGHPKMIEAIDHGTAGEEWVDRMLRSTDGATAGTRPVGPTRAIRNGDELKIGDTTFRFHHAGQAHTATDVMIQVVEDQVLFLADNVNNKRIVRMDDGSFTGNIAAADLALTIPAKVYVPGHGRSGDAGMIHAYRDYLSSLYAAVGRYYDEGLAPFEMKPKVAAELARFKDWVGFDDELGKHISLAALEYEKKMFE